MKLLALLMMVVTSIAFAKPPMVALRETTVFIRGAGSGSGAVVESPTTHSTYVLTNWHVCDIFSDTTAVYMFDDHLVRLGKIVKSDPTKDLCLIEATGFPSLKIGTSLLVGDKVWTRGYPQGLLAESDGVVEKFLTVQLNMSEGDEDKCPEGLTPRLNVFKTITGCIGSYPNAYTTLFSLPGASGSPVVNSKGELVGVVQNHKNGEAKSAGILTLKVVQEFMNGY